MSKKTKKTGSTKRSKTAKPTKPKTKKAEKTGFIGPTKLLPKTLAESIPFHKSPSYKDNDGMTHHMHDMSAIMRDSEAMKIHVHYFCRSHDWWIIDGCPMPGNDDYAFRGFKCDGKHLEFGTFSLYEIESQGGGWVSGAVERETNWSPIEALPYMRKRLATLPPNMSRDIAAVLLLGSDEDE